MTELSKKIIKSAANPNLADKMFAELGEDRALEILQQNHNKELTDEIFRQPALNGGLEYGEIHPDKDGNSEGVKFSIVLVNPTGSSETEPSETEPSETGALTETGAPTEASKKPDAALLWLKAIEAGKTPEEAGKLAVPVAKREAAEFEANRASMWKSENSYSKLERG